MELMSFNQSNKVNTLLILPNRLIENSTSVLTQYLMPLGNEEMKKVLVVGVETPEKGVLKKAIFLEEWEQIQEVIDTYQIKNIAVANPNYYKFIIKAKKKPAFEREMGSVKTIDNLNITPLINYLAIRVAPAKKALLDKSLNTIRDLINDNFKDDREDFINTLNIKLYNNFTDAYNALKEIKDKPYIACDIEATGLKWYQDDLLTISFAISETDGFSIALHKEYSEEWEKLRKLVKAFIEQYKGRLIFHNGMYDVPFLVYHLWMNDITDTKNMIKGVNHFNLDDTIIMAYLCLNNVDRPKLGLKELAYNKYGNWDKDIDQSKLIEYPFEKVGAYNTIDTMATMYLFNRYNKLLVDEEQDKLYNEFYTKLLPAIIKMKMNGITIDVAKIKDVELQLQQIYNENLEFLQSTDEVKEVVYLLKKQAEKKGKRQKEIDKIVFNPKSVNHLRVLLFDVLGLTPVKMSKKTGEPSTDKETINEIFNTQVKEGTIEYKIMNAIKEISEMKTVYSTFVKGFLEKYVTDKQGNAKLLPNFNIVGTISGRLAGKDPSLLNIPSGSKFGKIIKNTIIAPKNYLILQADSDQLEDRLITATTGCKNKAKIFQLGLDAHCSNTFAYWADEMPDIKEQIEKGKQADKFYLLKDKNVVTDLDEFDKSQIEKEITHEEYEVYVINSIKRKYPKLRQESKKYTFKQAYGGITEYSEKYEELYKEVFDFVSKTEEELLEKGNTTGFFNLKARADLKSILDKKTYQSVLRSIFNMRTQSGALIISKAIFELQDWIEEKGYEDKVKITNSVYDSIYIEIYNDPKIIQETSNKLIEVMCPDYRQYAPQIPDESCYIPLGAEAEIGNSWIAKATIPNNATIEEVENTLSSF